MNRWILLSCLFGTFSLSATPWEKLQQPSSGEAAAIGSYANGCLSGAASLPLNGPGYQVIRSERGRYYAHPDTVGYVEKLAWNVSQQLGVSLLVGDLSLPQGGLFSSGHSSHQTGLDIDIWLRLTDKPLAGAELSKPSPLSMVDLNRYRLTGKNWTKQHFELIKMAAGYPEVARIFVHPVIKQQLCDSESSSDRRWLRKVRPWWGHHYHMHVRLDCPQGSQYCKPQASPPPGDGCGAELASWRPQPKPKSVSKKPAKKKKPKVMPQQCQVLLEQSVADTKTPPSGGA